MEALCVGVGVLHGWHFLAWHSESLPPNQRYERDGRALVAFWALSVGLLPALIPDSRIAPRASACWLLAQVVDTIGFHGLEAPGWFAPVAAVVASVTLVAPGLRWVVALVSGLWLGVVWPWWLAPGSRTWWVAIVWELGVVVGMVGAVADLAPGQTIWVWGGPLSAALYTLLYTGRFVPGVLYGSQSYRVHDPEPAGLLGRPHAPARMVDPAPAAQGSGSGGSSGSDVPRVVHYDPDDWRSTLSAGWSSRDEDGSGGSAGFHPGQGGEGVLEQNVGESLLLMGV